MFFPLSPPCFAIFSVYSSDQPQCWFIHMRIKTSRYDKNNQAIHIVMHIPDFCLFVIRICLKTKHQSKQCINKVYHHTKPRVNTSYFKVFLFGGTLYFVCLWCSFHKQSTFHKQAFTSSDKSRSTLVFTILKGRESYSVHFKHGERIIVRRESCDITLKVLKHQVHRHHTRGETGCA